MAAKHYVIATNDGYIVDNVTGYPEEFASKQDAVKALTEIVRDAAERCRRSYKACSVVGTAREGNVQIRVGGRQGYHLWDRFSISERTGSRKPRKESAFMRELRGASTPSPLTGHARKKSPSQLQREIDEALAKPVHHARWRQPRRDTFAPGDPNNDDYLRSRDDVNDPPRTDLVRAHKDDRTREMDKPAAHATIRDEGNDPYSLHKVRLNSGGYDEDGMYFGHGEQLWAYRNRDDWGHLRASTREAAKKALRAKRPGAKFKR